LPWKRKKRPPIFEGDVAIKELRARLALAPDQMPEPPLYKASDPIFAVVARLMGVMVLAAAGALGFLWITTPHAAPPDSQAAGQPGSELALAYGNPEASRSLAPPPPASQPPAWQPVARPVASQPPPAAEIVKTERAPEAPASRSPWPVADYSRDLTDGVGTPPAAPAPRVAVAAPSVPAPRAAIPAPRAPTPPAPVYRAVAPAIEAPVAAPAPPPPAPPSTVSTLDRDEVAALLARARAYMSAGDVAAARLVLRRAAERDDSQAALALGGTYDPIVLKRLGVINFHADTAQARDWYRKAAELGSTDAQVRLDQLAQVDR